MQCSCCGNRIWVEPTQQNEIQIFTKRGNNSVETGVCLSIEDAQSLIEDIQNEIRRIQTDQIEIDYFDSEECKENGDHLQNCDDNGFCLHCGEQ